MYDLDTDSWYVSLRLEFNCLKARVDIVLLLHVALDADLKCLNTDWASSEVKDKEKSDRDEMYGFLPIPEWAYL